MKYSRDESASDNAVFQCYISGSTFRQVYFRLLTARGAIGSIHNHILPALSPLYHILNVFNYSIVTLKAKNTLLQLMRARRLLKMFHHCDHVHSLM